MLAQGTDQWVCIAREDGGPALVMPMLLETVEVGLLVYRARAKLAVRRCVLRCKTCESGVWHGATGNGP